MAEPPQFGVIRPTGTSSTRQSIRPKKYPTALKERTDAGVEHCHAASQSSRGLSEETFGTVNIRMPGQSPAAATASALPSTGWWRKPPTGISMFD